MLAVASKPAVFQKTFQAPVDMDIIPVIKSALRPIKHALLGIPKSAKANAFLKDVSGVIHVGANSGQERNSYHQLGLKVIWIEPIPQVFEALQRNIETFPDQRAFRELVTDVDGRSYQLNVASNDGASSSILALKQHKDIWPEVFYTETIEVSSITLNSLIQREAIDLDDYQALIMDTQGSELLVLQGSVDNIDRFSYIKTEVPNFESYEDCCQLDDIATFMTAHGFVEIARNKFASRQGGGDYFDIVYQKA